MIGQERRRARARARLLVWLAGALVAALTAVPVVNYTLNRFYVLGATFPDTGWFAFLSVQAWTWPLPNPPIIGGSFFEIHVSPIFAILAAPHALLGGLGVGVPAPVWFSLTQGLWFAMLAVSVFALLCGDRALDRPVRVAPAAAAGVLAAFNGVGLSLVGFPHFEIAIPALLIAFFALHLGGARRAGLVVLALGLLVREDAGLHYFGVFALLAVHFALMPEMGREARRWALYAVACLSCGVAALLYQHAVFGGSDAAGRIYLGSPPLSHVDGDFIAQRLTTLARERTTILAPLLALAALALALRDRSYAIGVVAVIPWLALQVVALSDAAGRVLLHYGFPLLIALAWPAVAARLPARDAPGTGGLAAGLRKGAGAGGVVLACGVSLALYPVSCCTRDPAPWHSAGPDWAGRVAAAHGALDAALAARANRRIGVDDAVASLAADRLPAGAWAYRLDFEAAKLPPPRTFLFQVDGWQGTEVRAVLDAAGLAELCRLDGTPFAVAGPPADQPACTPMIAPGWRSFDHRATVLDHLPGWSRAEERGRWTDGARVVLPLISTGGADALCVDADGYLPHDGARVEVSVLLGADDLLGRFSYVPAARGGPHCVELPGGLHRARIALALEGAQSPAALGLSADARSLGLFVRRVWLRETPP